eukprot:gene4798-5048_t
MPQAGANRKKIKSGSVRTEKKSKRASKGTARPTLTAAQLFDRAQQALAFERYDAATECLRDALQLEPENVEVLDAYGALLAELGQIDEAVQALQKAVTLSPDDGFEKYMYLGQLLQGEAALAAAQKGVDVLQLDLESSKQGEGAGGGGSQRIRKQLAQALCSLAEMRIGAADEVTEVSTEAESLLQQARAADPESPEPLQALASLRYEQGQAEEALQLLRQSLALWLKPQPEFKMLSKPVTLSEEEMEDNDERQQRLQGGCNEDDEDEDWADEDKEDEENKLPSYEFRFECAKMLLELEDTTDTAIQVLEDLIAENDSVPDVWHLLGLSYYSGGMLTEAAEVCKSGMQLLQKQRVGPEEEITASFQDLESAIQEAQTVSQT